jgi:hypothetical protein
MPTRHHRRGMTVVAVLVSAVTLACSSGRASLKAVAMAPNAQSAADILPADLDLLLWLDVARLRGLWPIAPDRKLAKVLAEYGVFAASSDAEAAFWLHLLAQSSRLWIGCRPTRSGCRDTVTFARGRYDRNDPLAVLPDTTLPVDLGAGWFRYARKVRVGRRQAARVYVAPPDRIVVVSPAELDAVERSLEHGQQDDSTFRVEERGLLSMTLRPTALARVVERRSPAAARLVRDASVIRLWLDTNAATLELTTVVSFASHEHAVHAQEAVSILLAILKVSERTQSVEGTPVEIVGNDLVLRLRFRSSARESEAAPPGPIGSHATEPAAQ